MAPPGRESGATWRSNRVRSDLFGFYPSLLLVCVCVFFFFLRLDCLLLLAFFFYIFKSLFSQLLLYVTRCFIFFFFFFVYWLVSSLPSSAHALNVNSCSFFFFSTNASRAFDRCKRETASHSFQV